MKTIQRVIITAIALLASGCAGMVVQNDGERVVLEHDMGISKDRLHELAVKACAQNGKSNATWRATANKNPRFEKGFGVQLSTFECTG